LSDLARNPYRILIRVPAKAEGLPAGELRRQLELLLEGLRSLGLSDFLVAPSESPRENEWNWVESWEDELFGTRIELWDRSSPSLVRDTEEVLAADLDSSNAAAVAALAVVIPFWPGESRTAGDWQGFAAVVDLGGEKREAGGERFLFAYPRQAVALLNHVGAGLSRRRSEIERDLGPVEEEEPMLVRGDPERAPPITRGAEAEVFLGVGLPEQAAPGEYFVARFAAYTAKFRGEIRRVLRDEAPDAPQRLDLERCRWQVGTTLTVRLAAQGATVEPASQRFDWDGRRRVLRFDVTVDPGLAARRLVLRFDLFVEGVQVASLRPEVALAASAGPAIARELEVKAPKTAFASYASEDRKEVIGRVRSVAISTGMDVFVDCLSLHPGQRWRRELEKEIARRDVFWLFWSRHASESEYVAWEWQTALRQKSLGGILPHPLEPADLAPPPPELAELHFGGAWEAYLAGLGKRGREA
jgi:hypothetical protein